MATLPAKWLSASLAVVALAASGCAGGGSSRSSRASTSTTAATAASNATGQAPTGGTCGPGTTVAGSTGGKEVTVPGDIPDTQAFVEYASPDGVFVVRVPEGWARAETASGVSFTDKLNTVAITTAATPAAPTIASTRADVVPALQRTAPCFALTDVTVAKRKGGDAILVTYHADSPADPVTGKVVRDDVERYSFWKNGHEAVLTLSASAGSDNVDPWRTVTDSFRWK
jgi:hypothetical protein